MKGGFGKVRYKRRTATSPPLKSSSCTPPSGVTITYTGRLNPAQAHAFVVNSIPTATRAEVSQRKQLTSQQSPSDKTQDFMTS